MKYMKIQISKIITAILSCILLAGGLTACKGPDNPPNTQAEAQIPAESAVL